MDRNIDDLEFVIFDTETTGLDPSLGDRIVELAALKFKGLEKISEFQTLINPGRPISEGAFAVNKISSQMLQAAPHPAEAIPGFINFIQGSCLCSYNAGFDLEFLNNEFKILGLAPLKDILIIDVLKMAKRLMPGLERYALWFVADTLGIKIRQEHRASSDVELTLAVFYKLKDMLKAKGITEFSKLIALFSIDPV